MTKFATSVLRGRAVLLSALLVASRLVVNMTAGMSTLHDAVDPQHDFRYATSSEFRYSLSAAQRVCVVLLEDFVFVGQWMFD